MEENQYQLGQQHRQNNNRMQNDEQRYEGRQKTHDQSLNMQALISGDRTY